MIPEIDRLQLCLEIFDQYMEKLLIFCLKYIQTMLYTKKRRDSATQKVAVAQKKRVDTTVGVKS